MTPLSYPEEFKPFEEMTVCSNKLEKAEVLFKIQDIFPLLIGIGEVPLLWVKAQVKANEWIDIVSNNISLNPNIIVWKDKDLKTTSIKLNGKIILNSFIKDEKKCLVDILDFRDLGLNIFGDNAILNIGGAKFVNNTFAGSKIVFNLNN